MCSQHARKEHASTHGLCQPPDAVDLDVSCREDIFKEIDILCGLNHENVVYLKEYFEEGNKVRRKMCSSHLCCVCACTSLPAS